MARTTQEATANWETVIGSTLQGVADHDPQRAAQHLDAGQLRRTFEANFTPELCEADPVAQALKEGFELLIVGLPPKLHSLLVDLPQALRTLYLIAAQVSFVRQMLATKMCDSNTHIGPSLEPFAWRDATQEDVFTTEKIDPRTKVMHPGPFTQTTETVAEKIHRIDRQSIDWKTWMHRLNTRISGLHIAYNKRRSPKSKKCWAAFSSPRTVLLQTEKF